MSQIEQQFSALLSKHPEIEKCYQVGLLNRRSLARHLIKQGIGQSNQLEAVIAMLRRFPFGKRKEDHGDLFKDIRVAMKDAIVILDFEKSRELLKALQRIVAQVDYDRGETLKIIVGSTSITLIIDQEKEHVVKESLGDFKVKNRTAAISELSLLFPSAAIKARGILATLTREFALHDITLTELLTASNELLIYLKEAQVMQAYQLVKSLQ